MVKVYSERVINKELMDAMHSIMGDEMHPTKLCDDIRDKLDLGENGFLYCEREAYRVINGFWAQLTKFGKYERE